MASWEDALALAKQQRSIVQRLFQEQLRGKPPPAPDDHQGDPRTSP